MEQNKTPIGQIEDEAREKIVKGTVDLLCELPLDLRMEVFSKFCRWCGSTELPCYCMAED